MSLYHTCPSCGANLDPGEQCDCEKIKQHLTKDCLILSFDSAIQGDRACLTISRNSHNVVDILNCYYDDEAKEMYSKLITQAPEGLIKHVL